MRRLGSSFLTLWIAWFIPSLCVWGFMVRWNSSTADQFETIWRWTADRLAFPLLLHRPTAWSWVALSSDSPLDASLGFLYLTGLWSLMLTLPLVVVSGWWMWLASRGSRRATDSPWETTHDPSPFAPLYILTLPIAVVGYGGRKTLAFLSPVLKPTVITFIVAWVVSMTVIMVYFWQVDPWKWPDALQAIRHDAWEGYLDALHIPRLFNAQWYTHWNALWAMQTSPNSQDRLGAPGDWHRHRDLWFLMAFHAARHAIAPTILVATGTTILQLFHLGGQKT